MFTAGPPKPVSARSIRVRNSCSRVCVATSLFEMSSQRRNWNFAGATNGSMLSDVAQPPRVAANSPAAPSFRIGYPFPSPAGEWFEPEGLRAFPDQLDTLLSSPGLTRSRACPTSALLNDRNRKHPISIGDPVTTDQWILDCPVKSGNDPGRANLIEKYSNKKMLQWPVVQQTA